MTGEPFFLPWIGTGYSDGVNGSRLLVLGESHYSENPANAYPTLTQDIVTRVVAGERFPFFTKLGQCIGGAATGREFTWQSVAFYNYVQQLVGAHARDRPTEQMWERAMAPFNAVLTKHQPHAILVAGVGTWNSLSRLVPVSALVADGCLLRGVPVLLNCG